MPEQHPSDSPEDFLLPWLRQLGPQSVGDTLLHFRPSAATSIDLTHAHPSGMAQMLAGRRTRLSTLLRDPLQYNAAKSAARALRAKIFELGTEHGLDIGYLAAGTASWRHADDAGTTETLTAPVLLTPVSLTVHSSQDDYELQLTDQARVNPALVRHLTFEQDVVFDADALARLAYGTARFDPHPVLERLRQLTEGVRGISVEHRILLATFADLADISNDPAVRADHPVLSALIESAQRSEPLEVAEPEAGFPSLDERHPADEQLILDADAAQQDVLDLIGAGHSLAVSAPPGTGQTQTALNAAAVLASQGKSVLVIAERRDTLREFSQQLESLNLGSVLLPVSPGVGGRLLKDSLVRAIIRQEKASEPALANLHRTLIDHRHQLLDHVHSLHNVRSRWGCSPYQAMQALAELTSLDPAPATTVRLKRSVLDSISDRVELTARLRRAADLGSFSKAATNSPWYGAQLLNRQDTERAHAAAVELARDIPLIRAKVLDVAQHSHITLGDSFKEWGEQLDLLVAVRSSLDKFTPDIFDRPVTDLISATAPASWRRERSIEMSSMTRSRLRRVAKEYIRPGVHISDLHASLVDVQEQRTLWTRYATTERHPSVPTGLAEINGFYRGVRIRLEELTRTLRGTPGRPELSAFGLDELEKRLAALAHDRQTLATLPERTLLLEEMREQGLGELLDDLAAREVPAGRVGSELELAWWQSALEAMISGDDYLAMSDGENLRRLEAEYRLADSAHIASGAARLRWTLAERWRAAIASHPEGAQQLRTALREDSVTLEGLAALHPDLVKALVPVWSVCPLKVSSALPSRTRFDTVIILDAESLALEAAVPAIARARQVVAFGDTRLGAPSRFSIEVDQPSGRRPIPDTALPGTYDALRKTFPERSLRRVYRGIDHRLEEYLSAGFYGGQLGRLARAADVSGGAAGLVVEYLPDGTGMPSSDMDTVESVAVEVNRVVDLVFEHIRHRPSYSLAVVTASARHAARVGEAIRLQLANAPWAADYFSTGSEPFRVVPVERAAGLVRDDIIFSLGFGRTPHGRALHSFGPLSAPDGRKKFILAMTRARRRLHVLSCFQPADLDVSRLTSGAVDFFNLLHRELGGEARPATGLANVPNPASPNPDPLVLDLVQRLRSAGAQVWESFGGMHDVIAAHPDAGDPAAVDKFGPPLVLESDGTDRYRSMPVRERSRLVPQLLERAGWRYETLWTIEVFSDPAGCAARVARHLGLEAVSSPDQPQSRREASSMRNAESGKGSPEGFLPTRAAEDEAHSWGEMDGNDDDWLRQQRPPHWG